MSADKIAYFDCFSGISGDMALGALVDCGLSLETIEQGLAGLGLSGYRFEVATGEGELAATRLRVLVEKGQPQRSWQQIRRLLEKSLLAEAVQRRALAIFQALAEAEAGVHGCAPEEVHFHEVGAVDAIVDIVGVAIGLDALGIASVAASPLPLGRGWAECDHGPLPLPAPAVCRLLEGAPVYGAGIDMELVTPTGAAILKGSGARFGSLPAMTLTATGYGAGSRRRPDGRPNLLRLLVGYPFSAAEAQEVEVIETNLDDWSPETFPHLSELLFERGALDVSIGPIQMKKGRPGFLLRVIAAPAHGHELKQTIFTETSAIGLRFRREARLTLPRRTGTVTTRWGEVAVKLVEGPAGAQLSPEYEDCRRLARLQGVPLRVLYAEVARRDVTDFVEKKKEDTDGAGDSGRLEKEKK